MLPKKNNIYIYIQLSLKINITLRKVHFLVALIDGEFVLKRAIESQNISKSAHYTWLKSDEAYRSLFEYLSSVRTRIAIDNMVDAVIEDASGNALISTNILARTKNEILDPLGLVNVNQIKTASSGSNTNIQIVVDLGDK